MHLIVLRYQTLQGVADRCLHLPLNVVTAGDQLMNVINIKEQLNGKPNNSMAVLKPSITDSSDVMSGCVSQEAADICLSPCLVAVDEQLVNSVDTVQLLRNQPNCSAVIVEQCATDSAQITSVHEQLVSLVDSAEQLDSQSVHSTAGLERQASNNGEKTVGQDIPAPQLHSSPVAAFPVCRADNQSSEHVTLSKSAAINFPFGNSSFPDIIMSMYRKPKATLLLFPHQIVIKKLNCKTVHEQLVSLVDSAEQLDSQSVHSTAGLERQDVCQVSDKNKNKTKSSGGIPPD
jgi:hypothetical protein